MKTDNQNPWAGLASYEDPETAEHKLKFCGRDDNSYDVAKLIMGNVFVTLYGKSGIGKTSLLNAGVFPELREEPFTPLSLRLGMRDEIHPQSYQDIIIGAIERTVKRTETINVIDEQTDQQATDFLWNYFARHRFYDKRDEATTPVVVFDQFEEVFRTDRKEAETLLRQIDYINDKDHSLDNYEADGQPYRYVQNYRFVVSIREDDLYRLEDSLDNCYLPALKRCRYRLSSLSEEGAREAILIPGKGLFKAEEQRSIVDTIISIARNKEDQGISTNILSLICSRIFVDFQKSDADCVSLSLVESFVKGNPFERFYNEATRGFSNREKSYIEEHLVDSTGRRNSISESDFFLNVPRGATLLEGTCKILQRSSTSSGNGQFRLELIHDSFCEPLARMKEKRAKQRRRRWFIITAAITLASLSVGAYFVYLYSELNHSKAKIEEYDVEMDEMDEQMDKKDQKIIEQDTLITLLNNKSKAFDAASILMKRILTDDGDRYKDLREYIRTTPELRPYIITYEVTYLGNGAYETDGIVYPAEELTDDDLLEWKEQNQQVCAQKIMGVGYDIPEDLRTNDPCTVYLLLRSKSFENDADRQNWFDLWDIMNNEQILKLDDILYRESYKQASINVKYEIKELNTKAYAAARDEDYDQALSLIDQAIMKKPDEAYLYDSKGEILLMHGNTDGAVEMWQKVIKLDPNFLDEWGETELYKKLKEQHLIN